MTGQNPERTSATILDENAESGYWRRQFDREPYYTAGDRFDDFESAYRAGFLGYDRYRGRSFEQAEPDLRNDWERTKGETRLTWERVKEAAKAAWHRVENAMPGDADRDGR